MKISEIITESRSQLDEGVMDTIKSKLSQVYQMARKKYPNFDEVFAIAKSHKAEINDIIEQLKAKKETGKVSKEDVVAAIMPLSKKVARDNVVNEGVFGHGILGGVAGGAMTPAMWIIGSMLSSLITGNGEPLDGMNTLYTCIAIGAALGAMGGAIEDWGDEKEDRRRGSLSQQAREREDLQREYDNLEWQYKKHRHEMSYAQTRRMEELYNQGFR